MNDTIFKRHIVAKTVKYFGVFTIAIIQSCWLLTHEHEFPTSVPWSLSPGSPAEDSLAVIAILTENDLSPQLLDSVAEFSRYARVQVLNLRQRGIVRIPDAIGDLRDLGLMDLSGNQLTSLPDAIGNLSHLKILDLSNNSLQSLPDSIIKLQLFDSLYYETGPCGWEVDCGYWQVKNGLKLQDNRLCQVPATIGTWIDRHFSTTDYLSGDTPQHCANQAGRIP